MDANAKTLLRTVQTYFPFCLDAKFALMRQYRNARGIPFDRDFDAIRLLPDREGALFLDVGGNRGQSTDAFLMLTRNSRVQLFEPNPLLCGKLRRQFSGNERVAINAFGLGSTSSEQPLYVPFYRKWMFDGLASFDAARAGDWLEGRILFYRRELVSLREIACVIRRLDDLNLAPFFIKLDVQGYEYEVIRGGAATIESHEPVLLIESPPEPEISTYLKRLGYDFYTFSNNTFVQGIAEGNNTYFMTEKYAALVKRHIVRR